MIDLLSGFRRRDHPIRLNSEFRKDLQWWIDFVQAWNGTNFFLLPALVPVADLQVTSDAAGAVGYGALYQWEWFNQPWMLSQPSLSIAYKELFPVVVAAHLWGHKWSRQRVCFYLDNVSIAYVLNSRTSKDQPIMHLLRALLMAAARYNFSFEAKHLPGRENRVADARSRFNWQVFRQLAPEALPQPIAVSNGLLRQLAPVH